CRRADAKRGAPAGAKGAFYRCQGVRGRTKAPRPSLGQGCRAVQRQGCGCRHMASALQFRTAHAYARLPFMSQANPIRLFVTHVWEDNDDYFRVFEYLESAKNFFYKNYSTPDRPVTGDKEVQREELRRQIAPVEAVVAIPSLLQAHRDMF